MKSSFHGQPLVVNKHMSSFAGWFFPEQKSKGFVSTYAVAWG
jgi:hypothetical protein